MPVSDWVGTASILGSAVLFGVALGWALGWFRQL